jgi:hypothetical protein
VAVLSAPAVVIARARVTSPDRAATRAYLEAKYAFERVLVASAPASAAAAEGQANRLGGECPRVLAGAPHETLTTLLEASPHSQSPRKMGELNRERRQRSELQGELGLAVNRPSIEAERQAVLAYARAVKSLRWSNSTLTALEHADAAVLEWELQSAPPEVCADMKTWARTAYKRLSPATKTLTRERDAIVRPIFTFLRQAAPGLVGADPLQSYEGAREKALSGKIGQLEHKLLAADSSVVTAELRLQGTLGLISQAETEVHEGPPKGSVEIGHGRTTVGSSYTVWLEPQRSTAGLHAPGCQLSVGVYEAERGNNTFGFISTGGSTEVCLSRRHPQAPSVQCRGEGLLTIEAQTSPRARTVRLDLSNGRQITSRVSIVPPTLGGPAGFYYQVVRPSPVPVSLTEADAHDRVLRSVKLARTGKCPEESRKPAPGIRTIVSGSLPGGPSFSILGERYSFMREIQFNLRIEVEAEGELGGVSSGSSSSSGGDMTRQKPTPFGAQIKTGCQPHEYAVLYGVLTSPGDTVLARVSGTLVPLRHTDIPADLHVDGVLAYIALPAVPSEVLVRTSGGKTIFTEKLDRRARESKETCEGEAEGPG